MDIVLHLGVHRTATTSFQRYMRDVGEELAAQGVGYWGPGRTRKGLLHGVATGTAPPGKPARPLGRVLLNARRAARQGVQHLFVSDENMLGTPRDNLRRGRLYAGAGQRMARFHAAFGGQVSRVVLTIRSPELYWASLLAYALPRGVGVPSAAQLHAMATARRGWRDVITDVACAMPKAEIRVLPFERTAGRHVLLTEAALDRVTPEPPHAHWINHSPDMRLLREVLSDRGEAPSLLPTGTGRWMPFAENDIALLREAYSDDLHWLRAGADGMATLIEDLDPLRTRNIWPRGPQTKGHNTDDGQEGRMAHTR